jgi:hypothetical protein
MLGLSVSVIAYENNCGCVNFFADEETGKIVFSALLSGGIGVLSASLN